MEVDIMELSKPDTIKMKLEDDPDATEASSSFGDSRASGNVSSTSDVEVDSRFCFNDNTFGFDGLENSSLFPQRKKKLTAHWRKFVRPLMWRCKWAELKMKDIQSQASKYDKELAAYDQMKKIEQDQLKVPGFASKSSSWTSSSRAMMTRRKIMKRRKRKRVEDSIDVKSYVSQHCLFSYLANKNSISDEEFFCKPEQTDIAHDKLNMNEDWLFNNSKDDLEPILLKIEKTQSRLRKLKSALATVISENASRFSSSENFSLHIPSDAQTSCARFDDVVMAKNCHGIDVPDIIESNVGLLTSVDVTTHQTQVRDTTEAIMDNVQLHNRVVMEPIKIERMKKHSEAETSVHGEISNLCKISASNANFRSNNGKDKEQKQPKAVNVGLAHGDNSNLCKISASNPNFHLKIVKEEPKAVNVGLAHGESSNLCKISASNANFHSKNVKEEEQKQPKAVNVGLESDISFPTAKRKRGERKPSCGRGWNR